MNNKFYDPNFWKTLTEAKISVQYSGKKDANDMIGPYVYKGVVQDIFLNENILTISVTHASGQKNWTRDLRQSNIAVDGDKIVIIGENQADIYIIAQTMEAKTFRPAILFYKKQQWNESFKNLVFFRHGSYEKLNSGEGGLSVEGRKSVLKTAERMRSEIDVKLAVVFSSVARRACETSLLIANAYEIKWEKYECAGSDESGDIFDFEELMDLIFNRSQQYQTIIISTHSPVCQKSISWINQNIFGEDLIPSEVLKTADALQINFENRCFKFFQ